MARENREMDILRKNETVFLQFNALSMLVI